MIVLPLYRPQNYVQFNFQKSRLRLRDQYMCIINLTTSTKTTEDMSNLETALNSMVSIVNQNNLVTATQSSLSLTCGIINNMLGVKMEREEVNLTLRHQLFLAVLLPRVFSTTLTLSSTREVKSKLIKQISPGPQTSFTNSKIFRTHPMANHGKTFNGMI